VSARPTVAALALLLCATSAGCARQPLSLCLPADGRFELRYLHSVERSPVVERYRVDGHGRLWLEGMRFRSVGWGLPADGFVRRDGWFQTTDPPRRLDRLVLRVSHLARQELWVGRRAVALHSRFADGSAVTVQAARTPTCPRALVVQPGP
jgi:hypothetical protein